MLARAAALENELPELNELSLGSPIFPGGNFAYAYGSLFVDFLSRQRGDSLIRRFVDEQSNNLIPWRLNHDASKGVRHLVRRCVRRSGVILCRRAHGRSSVPNLPGWRELTHHGYYAQDPRWVNDTTLVYASNDGRSTTAEYVLGLDGYRRRLGRRNSLGASVPLANGGLLFAQLEFTSPSEIRSDLYVERDGQQRRLTKGQRLVQPDVRKDGMIVAVQLAATRTRLLILDASGRPSRQPRKAERRTKRGASHAGRRMVSRLPQCIAPTVAASRSRSSTSPPVSRASSNVGRGSYPVRRGVRTAAPCTTSVRRVEFPRSCVRPQSGERQRARCRSTRTRVANRIFTPDVAPSGNPITAVVTARRRISRNRGRW